MASYPDDLTEGEGQKVMIAVAVANQPRLLIADEPTYSWSPLRHCKFSVCFQV